MRLARELGPPFRLPRVQSLQHLDRLKDRFKLRTYPRRGRDLKEFLDARFPATAGVFPFDCQWLHRVQGVRELRRLGLSLRNCLAEGACEADALAGNTVFFYILASLIVPHLTVVQFDRDPATGQWRFVTAEARRHQILSEEQLEWLRAESERGQQCVAQSLVGIPTDDTEVLFQE